MTDDDARSWIAARHDATTIERLEAFAALVVAENDRQNLISPATVPAIWTRHIVDSLQLLDHAPANGRWLDVGTGGGFPGLVIAIARAEPTTLVEPRRRRAAFLADAAEALGLSHVDVLASKVEQVNLSAPVISARAVASIENLLRATAHRATTGTRWLLPRGKVDEAELAATASKHRMMFHVEQSVTQAESLIVILEAR